MQFSINSPKYSYLGSTNYQYDNFFIYYLQDFELIRHLWMKNHVRINISVYLYNLCPANVINLSWLWKTKKSMVNKTEGLRKTWKGFLSSSVLIIFFFDLFSMKFYTFINPSSKLFKSFEWKVVCKINSISIDVIMS